MGELHEPPGAEADRALVRDAALVRISRTRRLTLAATAVLSAGLAALASALLPGKSFGAATSRSAAAQVYSGIKGAPPLPSPATAAELGLSSSGEQEPVPTPTPQASPTPAPSQQSAPSAQAAPQPAPPGGANAVVSGGS